MDFTIVCHTEFGQVINRKLVYTKDPVGTRQGVDNLIELANRYGAKVTFAVMPEVAGQFPKDAGHEVGLHVHPGWREFSRSGVRYHIGDAYLRERCRQSSDSVALMDYPYAEQLEMIRAGKDHISDLLGVEPRTFVAGKWSVNNDTMAALVRSGFTHDCSPLLKCYPHVYDWSRLKRICLPYHPREGNYQEKGNMPILIVPSSQMPLNENASPEVVPYLGMRWLKACFSEYYRKKIPLFSIYLHSPCMTDPYYIDVMDRLLSFAAKHKVVFRFISEIQEYTSDTPVNPGIIHYFAGINRNLIRSAINKINPRSGAN